MKASSLAWSEAPSLVVSHGLEGALASSFAMQLAMPAVHLLTSPCGPPAFAAFAKAPRTQPLYLMTQPSLPAWHLLTVPFG